MADFLTLFNAELDSHENALKQTRETLAEPFARLVEACLTAINAGGKIIFFGNGGSASDAQHLATELTVRYKRNRKAIAALSLSTDTSALTAIGNDFSFDDIFSRQIEALCKPEDVVIGISTSGQSPNVLKALQVAKTIGAVAAGFSGKQGGPMAEIADPILIVPVQETARIQEMHITLGHMLCEALEQQAD